MKRKMKKNERTQLNMIFRVPKDDEGDEDKQYLKDMKK